MNNNEERIDHNPPISKDDEAFRTSQAKKGSVTYYSGRMAEALMNEGQVFLEKVPGKKNSCNGVLSDQ